VAIATKTGIGKLHHDRYSNKVSDSHLPAWLGRYILDEDVVGLLSTSTIDVLIVCFSLIRV